MEIQTQQHAKQPGLRQPPAWPAACCLGRSAGPQTGLFSGNGQVHRFGKGAGRWECVCFLEEGVGLSTDKRAARARGSARADVQSEGLSGTFLPLAWRGTVCRGSVLAMVTGSSAS